MKHRPAASTRIGAMALVVTSCCVIASFAGAATSADGSYSGRTSQRHAISFQISKGAVRQLRYRIDDRCPGGKRLIVRTWGFPPLAIVHDRFGGTFKAKPPATAKAVVSGIVVGTTVRGTLSDQTRNRRSHRLCTGRASFRLTRRVRTRTGGP